MSRAALVIMAAGLGSRYGGNKQLDGVGPNGECLMQYSVFDAVRAGFDKVVFIIKPEILELVKAMCGDMARKLKTPEGKPVEVAYVYQNNDNVPPFYTVPKERTKPFGTCHAVLCARNAVQEPFCVINADDYYGVDAYRTIFGQLMRLQSGEATMVGYLLKNTVTEHGTVSRGICRIDGGKLVSVEEALKLQLFPDGSIANLDGDQPVEMSGDTIVSMNFWGFTPAIFDELEKYFHHFLRYVAGDNIKAECLLPNMVGELVQKGELQVSVLHSADRWFGMTYHEDRVNVANELKRLHENGTYPVSLRG